MVAPVNVHHRAPDHVLAVAPAHAQDKVSIQRDATTIARGTAMQLAQAHAATPQNNITNLKL